MSLALISNVPAGTTLPASGDVSASADVANDPALAEIANSVFADVLRVITQTLDAAPTAPTAAGDDDAADDTTDDAASPDAVAADATLPGMAMTMLPAALQAAGLSLAGLVQREATQAGHELSIGGLGSARTPRSTTALPEASAAPATAPAVLPNDHADAALELPAPGAASRPAAAVLLDAAPARVAVERQPVPTPSDASALSALAAPLPADRDAGAADAVLKLNATAPSQWRQPLQEALGDRLQLQLGRTSDHALIRLDPPTLGRIEILVRHENGSVQVHLSASNPEVLRQLNHIGDSLRQDLVARQHGEVSVTVSDTGRDAAGRDRSRDQPGQPDDTTPHRALAEADEAATVTTPFTLAHDRD